MKRSFTDIFIKRPVLATVVSLLILLVGARCCSLLELREYPRIDSAIITISTSYPGASADLMQNFITQPLQSAVATANGIDYLTSSSSQGVSAITAHIKLGFDTQQAFTDIMSQVASVTNELPRESNQPVIQKKTSDDSALMYMGFNSSEMTSQEVTAYLENVIKPKIESLDGVSEAQILGGSIYAMRIWLDIDKMAALGVTPEQVQITLQNNNVQSAAGQIEGKFMLYNVQATTGLTNLDQFKRLVVKSNGSQLVRLEDVAKVELGVEDYNSSVYFNGKKAVFMAVYATPNTNPLTAISRVNKEIPELAKRYPSGLKSQVVYDATQYIRSSIFEVFQTLVEATLIVILVILLFLGSLRTVLIPVVAIPFSIIGTAIFMLAAGYSLNLLTLLAFVLAIGMVVDDAIVVVENIYRHIEEGLSPYQASLVGAREIAMPVVAMSLTLAAVYAPVGFMTGLTGQLFTEFAFTLAGTVVVSGVIALVLSPMLSSKVLSSDIMHNKMVILVDNVCEKMRMSYLGKLRRSLDYRPATVLLSVVVVVSCYFLYTGSRAELAPAEDFGTIFVSATGPTASNLHYIEKYTDQIGEVSEKIPEASTHMFINGPGSAFGFIKLKPWSERKRSQEAIMRELQQNVASEVTGVRAFMVSPPPLPGSSARGLPVQFVLTSTGSFEQLYNAQNAMVEAAQKSGLFLFAMGGLEFDKPLVSYDIDRDRAIDLGVDISSIANTLALSLGGGSLQRFSMLDQSFEVFPQLLEKDRSDSSRIKDIRLQNKAGDLITLGELIKTRYLVQPSSLSQFQQLNSTTVSAMPRPGVSIDEGLAFFRHIADTTLPLDISYSYSGESRQYMQEGNQLLITFVFSMIIIYLVLAAQFESFTDPFIILISVPMSICGALIPIYFGAATINIYTQIGLITLIGLIAKHGILIVEFANQLQIAKGVSRREAVEEASATRLRPILMTTAAMVFGVIPLILATGAGANSRFDIGIVLAFGMSIGTLFTLFVVPTMYTFFARDHVLASKKRAQES